MRNSYFLFVALLGSLMFQACSSSKYATRGYDDEIYYTSKDDKIYGEQYALNNAPSQNNTSGNPSEQTKPFSGRGDGNTSIVNNYYGNDNVNYPYSCRINRFYHPSLLFSYYDPFYNPYDPYFSMGMGMGMGMGYGYYDPYFGYGNPYFGYGNPYYGGYYSNKYYDPYSSYYRGYWNGYYSGIGNYGSGSGSGSGRNTYYGSRVNQGSYNIYNSSNGTLPPGKVNKEFSNPNSGNGNTIQMTNDKPRYNPNQNPVNNTIRNEDTHTNTINIQYDNGQRVHQNSTGSYNENRPIFSSPRNENSGISNERYSQPSQSTYDRPSYSPRSNSGNESIRSNNSSPSPSYNSGGGGFNSTPTRPQFSRPRN